MTTTSAFTGEAPRTAQRAPSPLLPTPIVIPAKAGTYWMRPSAQAGTYREHRARPGMRIRDSRLRGNDGDMGADSSAIIRGAGALPLRRALGRQQGARFR